MLGLAERGRATVGVIVVPISGRTIVGITGEGAWKVAADGTRKPIDVSVGDSLAGASFVVSRSRQPDRVRKLAKIHGGTRGGVARQLGAERSARRDRRTRCVLAARQRGNAVGRVCDRALPRTAGGACTEANGAHFDYAREATSHQLDGGLVASNGRLHERLVKALSENLPSY